MKKNESTILKENICNSLNGKRYTITWSNDVNYSVEVIAGSREEAEDMFWTGNYPEPSVNDEQVDEGSLEIYED